MGDLNRFYYESPDGLRYYFDGRLLSHSNIGLPPVKFIEDFGPSQNGSTLRDWRINPRTISLDIFLQGDYCCGTRGEQLAEMIDIIRPNRGEHNSTPGWLRFVNDNVKMMEIPVHVSQGPSGNYEYNGEVGRYQVLDAVQFYAADPIWREYAKKTFNVVFSEGGICLDEGCLSANYDSLAVLGDFCLVPETFVVKEFNELYRGTWDGDQIDIRLVGRMSNPIITNQTLNKKIELNYTITSGSYVDITIRPEYISVVDNNGNNLIGTVTSLSDLVDFVIKSPGEITPTGYNSILISATDSDDNASIEFSYWVRHISAYGTPECTPIPVETVEPVVYDLIFNADDDEISASVLLLPNAPDVQWVVTEANGAQYVYNNTSFTHTRNYPGAMTVNLNGEVVNYITSLIFSGSGLFGSTDLSRLSNITYLDLSNNNLSEIGDLSNLVNLQELRVQDNQIMSLGDITSLINLQQIRVQNNQLSEINELTGLTNLTRIYAANNMLTSIGDLDALGLLYVVYLENNDLTDIGTPDLSSAVDFRITNNYSLATDLYLDNFSASQISIYADYTLAKVYPGVNPMTNLGVFVMNFDHTDLTQSEVDDILEKIWDNRNSFNAGFHQVILTGNPYPSGIYQAANPPTTGAEFAYELVNDSNGEGFQTWSVLI